MYERIKQRPLLRKSKYTGAEAFALFAKAAFEDDDSELNKALRERMAEVEKEKYGNE
ncbi:hypothetical protein [Evansella tamaricis]|uniref:Uncharacterized protein n=1 Tax=Evansella tamaricis TaxID=2069301 RepID=A0ABS6JL88_9BACI|nr:hypothetical protein [Evansella tamaricis]MBU9714436.1 hypothetical protein [Evansella tamaricis]